MLDIEMIDEKISELKKFKRICILMNEKMSDYIDSLFSVKMVTVTKKQHPSILMGIPVFMYGDINVATIGIFKKYDEVLIIDNIDGILKISKDDMDLKKTCI